MCVPPVASSRRILLVRLARELRSGVYLLDDPIGVPSSSNFWEWRDHDHGDCTRRMVGTPITYFLHAVRIRRDGEWEGFDDPHPAGLGDARRRRRVLRGSPALSFSPAELTSRELMRFLHGARRVDA